MAIFIVHWPCLSTTKLGCLQKNKWGHAKVGIRLFFESKVYRRSILGENFIKKSLFWKGRSISNASSYYCSNIPGMFWNGSFCLKLLQKLCCIMHIKKRSFFPGHNISGKPSIGISIVKPICDALDFVHMNACKKKRFWIFLCLKVGGKAQ